MLSSIVFDQIAPAEVGKSMKNDHKRYCKNKSCRHTDCTADTTADLSPKKTDSGDNGDVDVRYTSLCAGLRGNSREASSHSL